MYPASVTAGGTAEVGRPVPVLGARRTRGRPRGDPPTRPRPGSGPGPPSAPLHPCSGPLRPGRVDVHRHLRLAEVRPRPGPPPQTPRAGAVHRGQWPGRGPGTRILDPTRGDGQDETADGGDGLGPFLGSRGERRVRDRLSWAKGPGLLLRIFCGRGPGRLRLPPGASGERPLTLAPSSLPRGLRVCGPWPKVQRPRTPCAAPALRGPRAQGPRLLAEPNKQGTRRPRKDLRNSLGRRRHSTSGVYLWTPQASHTPPRAKREGESLSGRQRWR